MNTHDSYEVNIPEGADAKKMTERVQESIRSRDDKTGKLHEPKIEVRDQFA
jgi:hypothetical protein